MTFINTHIKKKRLSLRNVFVVFLIVFSSNACRDPYLNEELDASKKIPVINAVISNVDKLNILELYYAMPYSTQYMDRISGATIRIKNFQGNSIELYEFAPGFYRPEQINSFLKSGDSYTASIELPDGTHIESEQMPFYDTIEIENIFYDINKKTITVETSPGEFNEVTTDGIFVYARLKYNNDKSIYYRSHSDYYVHSRRSSITQRQFTRTENDTLFTYTIRIDTLFDVIDAYSNAENPVFGKLETGIDYSFQDLTVNPIFLKADPAANDFSYYTSNEFVSWIIPIDVYSHSQAVYNYYQKAKEQLSAPNRIYDPIPEQLIGNLKNKSDSNEVVLGLFDISSVNRKYFSISVYNSYGVNLYRGDLYADTIFSVGKYLLSNRTDTILINMTPLK